jgi:DNA-binding NtrC family response regulator
MAIHRTKLPSPGDPPDALIRAFATFNLIGRSPAFIEMLRFICRYADCDAPILIQGETGTGKELVARALHYLSTRAAHAFIPVNCGALPDSLVESELFGHERGAFTDAHAAQKGLVAQAAGGTLLLDEIDSLSPKAQVTLLRFLQDRQYRPVGGERQITADVRVVAATNADLAGEARAGRFRQDLYYRLDVVSFAMPPLRQRGDDVVDLAEHLLGRFAQQHGRPRKHLHPDTAAWLPLYAWPGNVRELENLMLREFLRADGDVVSIEPVGDALPALRAQAPRKGETFKLAKACAVAEFERSYLSEMLARTSGNVSLAARLAKKDRGAFNKLVKKHGLDMESFRSPAAR